MMEPIEEKPKDKLLDEIKNHPYWYHSFDLGNGEKIIGWTEAKSPIPKTALFANEFSFYHIPKSLTGYSVLDIAGWDGALSFECEKRGANRVILNNLKNIADSDYALAGAGSWSTYKSKNLASEPWSHFLENGAFSQGALLMKKWLNSKVEVVEATVYELDKVLDSSFDLVLCCGLLYHLRDPILALQVCRRLTKKQIIVEAMCLSKRRTQMYNFLPNLLGKGRRTLVEYLPEQGDGSDWWCFSVEALKEMMKDADFKNVEIKEHIGGRCVLVGYV